MPLKRFSPPTSLCCHQLDSEKVLNFLSEIVPFEHRKPDAVDSLMSRMRF